MAGGLTLPAHAETAEIRRVTPIDGSVCKLSQQIIVIKCVRATTIDCEEPGAPVAFDCVGGVAAPPSVAAMAKDHSRKTPEPHQQAKDHPQREHKLQPLRNFHHHHHPKTPLQSLFDLFRAHPH